MKDIIAKLPVDLKFKKGRDSYRKLLYGVALLVASTLLLILLAFRYYGLPVQIEQKLLTELQRKGLSVHFSKIYLDPFGRVVARDVEVSQEIEKKITSVRVDKVKFSFNWLSWWRGEPFLSGALVQNARIAIPITDDTAIDLDKVSAEVDLRQDSLWVKSAEASIGMLIIRGRGSITMNGKTPSSPPSQIQTESRARMWEKIRNGIGELNSPLVVDVEFDVSSKDPLDAKVKLSAESRNLQWHGVMIRRLILQSTYAEHLVRIGRAQVEMERGALSLEGTMDLNSMKGTLTFRSDADLGLFVPLVPEKQAEIVKEVKFTRLPRCNGTFECDWTNGFNFFGRLNFDWETFFIGSEKMEGLRLVASTDGSRIFISDFTLLHHSGNFSLQLMRDQDQSIRGQLRSGMDLTALRSLFGKGAKNFFDNISFQQPPQIECKIAGDSRDLPSLKFDGTMLAKDFSYRNGRGTLTKLASIQSSFSYSQKVLTLPDLKLSRVKGEDGSASVVYDFNTRLVEIKNAKTRVNVEKFTPVFGGKLEVYVKPYRFFEPPTLTIDGVVDLDTQKKTNLKVHIESEQGMEYNFLGKAVTISKIKSDLEFVGQQLSVKFKPPTTLFAGNMTGGIDLDLAKEGPFYKTQLKFEKLAFDQLLRTYFNKEDVKGTMSGEIKLTGRLDDMKSIEGGGSLSVTEGDVYKIPFLGALSIVMSAIIPDAGYSKADRAKAEFIFSKGVVSMSNVEIYSALFAVIGGGKYDYIQDDLDMSMRVNVRGIMGIPLFLVSKLFEYQGTGKLSTATWEPKNF